MHGGTGNDLISGNFGDDIINGNDGNDTLFGADGDDEVHGGPGNDLVNGNSLNDLLTGGTGDDTLDGGINVDTCGGGPGLDTATRKATKNNCSTTPSIRSCSPINSVSTTSGRSSITSSRSTPTRLRPKSFWPPAQPEPNAFASATASNTHPPTTTTLPEWQRKVATLDLISRGRVEFGIGEGATRMELGGFDIPAKQKRAMSIEAGEQIANMMTLTPYPGFEGESFSFPCNVLPKPSQKPHPPMWIACTNRSTIELAARLGIGALAFTFVDPAEAEHWVQTYYDIIKSDECVPLGHTVNANIALVTGFSLHQERAEAIRRGREGFEFFQYAISAMVTKDSVPGRTNLWQEFQDQRGPDATETFVAKALAQGDNYASAIGTPDDARRHIRELEAAGVADLHSTSRAQQPCGHLRGHGTVRDRSHA
ncbi:Iron-regulated protein FrpC [Nymphon striatum]|nr:Iron-regulated protein FrpC [Nymphon striatum]